MSGKSLTVIATGNWDQPNKKGLRSQYEDPYTLWTVPVYLNTTSQTGQQIAFTGNNKTYKIRNVKGDEGSKALYLSDDGNGNVICSSINYGNNSKWEFTFNGTDCYTITNVGTGKALTSLGDSDGSIVKDLDVNEDYSKWYVQFQGDKEWWIYNKRSDLVMGDTGTIQTKNNWRGAEFKWRLEE